MHTGLRFGSCRIFCKGPSFKNMLDWTFAVSGRIHELNLTNKSDFRSIVFLLL